MFISSRLLKPSFVLHMAFAYNSHRLIRLDSPCYSVSNLGIFGALALEFFTIQVAGNLRLVYS